MEARLDPSLFRQEFFHLPFRHKNNNKVYVFGQVFKVHGKRLVPRVLFRFVSYWAFKFSLLVGPLGFPISLLAGGFRSSDSCCSLASLLFNCIVSCGSFRKSGVTTLRYLGTYLLINKERHGRCNWNKRALHETEPLDIPREEEAELIDPQSRETSIPGQAHTATVPLCSNSFVCYIAR